MEAVLAADPEIAPGVDAWPDLLETGVLLLDSAVRLEYMNHAAVRALGSGPSRLLGESLGESAGIPVELNKALLASSADGRSREVHDCELAGGPHDCSVQPRASGGLLIELRSLAPARERQQREQMEVKAGVLDVLARNLGHEIRNPLGGIRGAAQILAADLADEFGDGEQVELAQLIMREVDRIDDLLGRFGEPELRTGPVDVHRLLDEAADVLLAEAGGGVRLEQDFDPSIPELVGDSAALRQILLNVLRNAWQSSASVISLTTRVAHSVSLLSPEPVTAVRIEISDNGEGVPEGLRPLLFLPLATGRRDGTGLGLAVSQQIAAAHGGLLTYDPLPEGSRFVLSLPLNLAGGDS